MDYRILGPLEVSAGEQLLPLGPVKQRALLAVLLLNSGKTVSRDRLIDDLWGERAPRTAPKAIQNFVSRLRKLVPPDTIRTRTPGYVIELGADEFDLKRFERLLADGRTALASGEPEMASILLRDALALWRGPALEEFVSEPFGPTEGARLEELRLEAVERWVESELALGHHAQLVGELESLVVRFPLREGFAGQLMVALYRSSRQAEALAVYQTQRRTLVEELGIEPSAALQDLERAILRQDGSLALMAPAAVGAPSIERVEPPPEESSDRRSAAVRPRERARPSGTFGIATEAFVGRVEETARLEDALRRVLHGSGNLVMLVGEPGIGKTRTAANVAVVAERAGARVYWGGCYEREGAPPYWPWVQAVRSYVRECEPDELRSQLGTGGAEIAEVILDIRDRLPHLTPSATVDDPRQARFRLFDSFARFLKRAAQVQPLVLVLDDLHWADSDSLALLEFVTRELAAMHLLIIGTYRDIEVSRRHPLFETLAELTRERHAERIRLHGLSRDDVARCIEATSGIVPPVELAEAVHTKTEGNPLFVTEVVRLLVQEGALTPEQLEGKRRWNVPLPEGVREVIGKRLGRLSEGCSDALTNAAVIGREFDARELRLLIDDVPDEQLLQILEEALAARVIEELPETVERYRFTHALIQEVIEQELSASRRVRLHAQIIPVLEQLHAVDVDAHAAELAYHAAEAEPLLGSDMLVHYSLLAGERALATHAYDEAIAQYERALSAKEGEPPNAELAELVFGLGRAQFAALDARELGHAVANVARAFEYYVEAGDPDGALEVAAYPVLPSWPLSQTEFPSVVRQALALAPPGSLQEGRLLAMHGYFLGVADADYDGAKSVFDRALAIGDRQEDTALQRNALGSVSRIDWLHLRLEHCLETAVRLSELAEQADDDRARVIATYAITHTLTSEGRRREARSHATTHLEAAERLGDGWWLAGARSCLARISALEGDWTEARRQSDLGLAKQPNDCRLLIPRAIMEYEIGDFESGEVYLGRVTEALERFPPPGPIGEHGFASVGIPSLGLIDGSDARNSFVEGVATNLLSLPRLVPLWRVMAQTGLGLLAVQRTESIAADHLYTALEPQAGTTIPYVHLAADRLLGLLARTCGRLKTATAHFEDALAFCDQAGYRPQYAWTASDYVETLHQHGGPTDRTKAAALHDEALAIARELDMRPLTERLVTTRRPR